MIQIRKSQTKQEGSIISDKTRDTNKSSIPSISPFSSFKTLSDDSQTNLQDFIKNGKKEIVFEDSNNKEIIFSEKKLFPKIKIKDSQNLKKSQTSEENNSNNSSLKENDYQKKKQLYDATKYLNILSSTINGLNYNNEEKDDNETIINNDFQNLDEIVLTNPSQTQKIKKSSFKKSVLTNQDKKEIENIKKKIENKLGNEFTKYMIKYVSENTNKELLNFDQKQIEDKLRKDYENKKINKKIKVLNDSTQVLNEIYYHIVDSKKEKK